METLWVEKDMEWVPLVSTPSIREIRDASVLEDLELHICNVFVPPIGKVLHECEHHVVFIRRAGTY